MTAATDWFEILSYALIAVVGAWLTWSKAFGHHHHHHAVVVGAEGHDHASREHDHDHDHHGHDHRDHAEVGAVGGHSGAPAMRAWSAILAVGVRPCSGALIILVFALSQGLFFAGVAATFIMAIGTGLTVATLATLAVSARGVAVRLAGEEFGANRTAGACRRDHGFRGGIADRASAARRRARERPAGPVTQTLVSIDENQRGRSGAALGFRCRRSMPALQSTHQLKRFQVISCPIPKPNAP